MSLSTYLYFDGNCAEAFEFYKSVFGGDFLVRQTFADGPAEMQVPADERDRIMHVTLPVGTSVLMGSDTLSTSGEATVIGRNFAVSFRPDNRAEAERVFSALSAGGAVAMPLAETFWGSYFGMCKDKFGVHWMLNMELNQTAK